MTSIQTQYNRICKKHLMPLGFVKYKTTWGRIVNDVYQCIYFEGLPKSFDFSRCRICFGIHPLGMKIEPNWYADGIFGFYLNIFKPECCDPFESDCFLYSKYEEDILRVSNEIEQLIVGNLLPLFTKADNCSTAYNELKTLNKISFPQQTINYHLALKTKNYSHALELRKDEYDTRIDGYKRTAHILSEEKKAERLRCYEKLKTEITMLETECYSYFDKLLIENEKHSLDSWNTFLKDYKIM